MEAITLKVEIGIRAVNLPGMPNHVKQGFQKFGITASAAKGMILDVEMVWDNPDRFPSFAEIVSEIESRDSVMWKLAGESGRTQTMDIFHARRFTALYRWLFKNKMFFDPILSFEVSEWNGKTFEYKVRTDCNKRHAQY